MKLRHAAALALVGWYLMLHPCIEGTQRCAAESIAHMERDGSYETKQLCEQKGNRIYDELVRSGEAASRHIFGIIWECVASDDPRLKSN